MRGGSVALIGLVAGMACAGEPVDAVPALTVVTWAGMLEQRTDERYEQRRDAIVSALAASRADVVCLTNVFRREDHELLRAKAGFPYYARVDTDLATRTDDETDRTGAIPVAPETAPCEDVRDSFEAAVACGVEKCASTPGSPDATLRPNCLANACTAQVAELYAAPRCLFCVRNLQAAMDVTLREAHDQCLGRGNPSFGIGWAFHGQNDLAILSRRPLRDVGLHLVGSTGMRAGVLHARVDDVHLFCASLSRTYNVAAAPCVGPYCEGLADESGWARENLLQAEKILAHVRTVAGSDRAILFGNFWASPKTLTEKESAAYATYQTLLGETELGVHPSFPPSCDFCVDNPFGAAQRSYWYSHIMLRGIPRAAVSDSRRVFVEPVIEGKWPASTRYGLQSTVLLDR